MAEILKEHTYKDEERKTTPILGYSLFQIDETNNIILYRGHRFSMARWPHYLPPRFITVQGRQGKESFSPENEPSPGKCCGLPLLSSPDGKFYCQKCGLEGPWDEPRQEYKQSPEAEHSEELYSWYRWITHKLDPDL